MRHPRAVIGFAFIVLGCSAAVSAPIVNNGVVLCNTNNTNCQTLVTQSTTLNYSSTQTNGPNSISITSFADENLTTGELKASESYSEPASESFYTQVNTVAEIADTVTVIDPFLTGDLGFLQLQFAITGTTTANAQGSVIVALADPAGSANSSCANPATLGCYFQGNLSFSTVSLPFHYGDPFTLSWALAGVTYPGSGYLTGSAEYGDTAQITGFSLFDSAGNPVYNATVTASGGEQFTVLTPEPASILLVGIGVLALSLLSATFRARGEIGR